MILEEVYNANHLKYDVDDIYMNNPYWISSKNRLMSFRPAGVVFNTYAMSSLRLCLKTQNCRIIHPEDMRVIRRMEEDLHTYKIARARLFHCDWRNNDIPV